MGDGEPGLAGAGFNGDGVFEQALEERFKAIC